jgi:hypothetical protein
MALTQGKKMSFPATPIINLTVLIKRGDFMKERFLRLFCVGIFILCLALYSSTASAAQDSVEANIEMLNKKMASEHKNALKKDILNRLKKSNLLVAYKAFRSGNLGLCDSASLGRQCWQMANSFVFYKVLAQGNCNALPPANQSYADVCSALKNSSCASLAGWKKLACQAIDKENAAMLKKAYSAPDFPEYMQNKDSMAQFGINLYAGFKTNSEAACNKFSKNVSLLRRASCNMIFGNQSFLNSLEGISEDIAEAVIAKEQRNKDRCNRISDPSIKSACMDDDVLNKVWF